MSSRKCASVWLFLCAAGLLLYHVGMMPIMTLAATRQGKMLTKLCEPQVHGQVADGKAVQRRDPASRLVVHEADQDHRSQEQQFDWCATANDRPLSKGSQL